MDSSGKIFAAAVAGVILLALAVIMSSEPGYGIARSHEEGQSSNPGLADMIRMPLACFCGLQALILSCISNEGNPVSKVFVYILHSQEIIHVIQV